jgi:uncharacterized membrane protein
MREEPSELTEELRSRIEFEARDKARLETFVDAVFAIAITLLGLEFVVPLLQHSDQALAGFLVSIYPKFVGYFLAFFLLGILLNSNWRQFQNIRYADWKLFLINMVFLAFVVLVPFATSIWTEYANTTAGVMFFDVVVLFCGVMLYSNWSYVRRHPYLLQRGITSNTLRRIHYRNVSVVAAPAAAIGFAFFSPALSNLAYVLIVVTAILIQLRIRGRDDHGTEQKRRRTT